jgi:effector-binding domain-containing protein
MTVNVTLSQVRADPIAVVRRRARQNELAKVVPAACGEVWNFIRASGYAGAGRNIAVYLDGEINLECGVEVTSAFVPGADVHLSATPAGTAAHAVHIGPYARLGDTHDAIRVWCAEQGHRFAIQSWEIYGHWTDDVSQLRTDVFYLLA